MSALSLIPQNSIPREPQTVTLATAPISSGLLARVRNIMSNERITKKFEVKKKKTKWQLQETLDKAEFFFKKKVSSIFARFLFLWLFK